MLLHYSIFSSERDQSTDPSVTLSAIFSSYSDSEEEEEEEEEDPNCHSINLETHSTFSDKTSVSTVVKLRQMALP